MGSIDDHNWRKVQEARGRQRASGAPKLHIGVLPGPDVAVGEVIRVLTRLCTERNVGQFTVVWPALHRDALDHWSRGTGAKIVYCSEYVLITTAHRLDGVVALRMPESIVRRVEGTKVWEPLRRI